MRARIGLALTAAATIAAAIAACGGKVVVDQSSGGDGGDGASGSSSSTTSSTVQGSGGCFFAPPPVGALDPNTCRGTGSSMGSGEPECTTLCTDQDNHVYEVTCQGKACRCVYDNKTICTCAIDGDATLCGGGAASCCPPPWISF